MLPEMVLSAMISAMSMSPADCKNILLLPDGLILSTEFIDQHFNKPIVVACKTGLGLKLPQTTEVEGVCKLIGLKSVVNVKTSTAEGSDCNMTVQKFLHLRKTKPLNMITDILKTKLEALISIPSVVGRVSWTEAYPLISDVLRKWAIITSKGCTHYAHVDGGGVANWFHMAKGVKIFTMALPTEYNLRVYQDWASNTSSGNETLFKQLKNVFTLRLSAGQTMFMPSGVIHFVETPEESVAYGGLFYCDHAIPMQLRIYSWERQVRPTLATRVKNFELLNYLALSKLLNELRNPLGSITCRRRNWLLERVSNVVPVLKEWLRVLQAREDAGTLDDQFRSVLLLLPETIMQAEALCGCCNVISSSPDVPNEAAAPCFKIKQGILAIEREKCITCQRYFNTVGEAEQHYVNDHLRKQLICDVCQCSIMPLKQQTEKSDAKVDNDDSDAMTRDGAAKPQGAQASSSPRKAVPRTGRPTKSAVLRLRPSAPILKVANYEPKVKPDSVDEAESQPSASGIDAGNRSRAKNRVKNTSAYHVKDKAKRGLTRNKLTKGLGDIFLPRLDYYKIPYALVVKCENGKNLCFGNPDICQKIIAGDPSWINDAKAICGPSNKMVFRRLPMR